MQAPQVIITSLARGLNFTRREQTNAASCSSCWSRDDRTTHATTFGGGLGGANAYLFQLQRERGSPSTSPDVIGLWYDRGSRVESADRGVNDITRFAG